MPAHPPPSVLPGVPVVETLFAGTRLVRLHDAGYPADSFNPSPLKLPPRGGRFDIGAAAPHVYAGHDVHCAVAESLLRGVSAPGPPPRIVPKIKLRGVALSTVELTCDVSVVALHGGGLTVLGQDAWLTACAPAQYALPRQWAQRLRVEAPAAAGLRWRSRIDNGRFALVLYADRLPPGALSVVDSVPADAGLGLTAIRLALADYQAVIATP